MTRISKQSTLARVMTGDGAIVDLGDVSAELNLDESQSPYGDATVTFKLPTDEATLALLDPREQGGLRLLLEFRESVGDPVILSEITADHGGDVSTITAAYGPALTPAKVTTQYFTGWNDDETRPGATIRSNLLASAKTAEHSPHSIIISAATDEAMLQAYRLAQTVSSTSGSLSVRDTVNFALSKIGAVLIPGPVDATVADAAAIIWEPGVSGWEYVSNIAEAAGLVVRCDERRRWTLTNRDDTAGNFTPSRFTEARDVTDITTDLYADGVVVRYDWADPTTGVRMLRFDVATQTEQPFKVVRIDRSVPFPGAGAARYWLRRLAARGRVLELEQVSDYTARPGQAITASLPHTPAQIGYVESVTWRLPEARQSIRTRGTADAVPNAISTWQAGVKINDLVGKINAIVTVGT